MPTVEINQSSNRLQLLCKPPHIIYLSNDIMPIHSEHLKSVISRSSERHACVINGRSIQVAQSQAN
ncbi:hypothetical protein NC651_028091 [Populus alba x Populus x berolinensis]|nr:hypothetical protein NC651_028091 [Populus alba x Populus x berolinensis]